MDGVNSARGEEGDFTFFLDGLSQLELYDVYFVIVT